MTPDYSLNPMANDDAFAQRLEQETHQRTLERKDTEIARLTARANGAEGERDALGRELAAHAIKLADVTAERDRLRAGLDAAIRAANLALFVINKHGVMPNSSWQGGFEGDLATAKAARDSEQSTGFKEQG